MIELVIFDCDGVLVDSEGITHRVITEALRAQGVPLGDEETLARFMGGKMADILDAIEAEFGATFPDDFLAQVRARVDGAIAEGVEAIPDITWALDRIDVPTCVASNGPHSKMQASLGRTGLLSRFEGRLFSAYDLDVFKPDPGLFLHAARTLGADPRRSVVIEDSDLGLQAARRAGMAVLAFAHHGRAFEAPADGVFDAMGELPERLEQLTRAWRGV